jgi:glycerophosphoryl diester phosphodiesterase
VTLVIAHRGASADETENTLPAFERAIELGADYTVNDEARMRELRDLGVDGIVTDVPDRALAALGRRPSS